MSAVFEKKIIFVSHEASVTGATFSMISLIKGIRKIRNDINVEVILPINFRHSEAAKLMHKNDIKFRHYFYKHDFKEIENIGILKKIKYSMFDVLNLCAMKTLYYYIRKYKNTIVCSNSTAVDIGAEAALLAEIPHIFYIREFMEEDFGITYRNEKGMKKLLERSKYAVFISSAIETKYRAKYTFQNAQSFFNGFILEDYYVKNHDILIDDEISFVQIGTFCDGKGTRDTIEVLHKLEQNGIKSWRFEFIGRGSVEYTLRMKKLISEYNLESKVIINGFSSEVREKLASKDVLIMNSRAEGFGRVTVEGMLAGCLVIGRLAGGTAEILTDGLNGMTFESDAEFIRAIQNVVDNREMGKRLAKNGQLYAIKKFNYIETAKRFIEVMEKCF